MVASEAPDWLPSGWTVQVKVHNYGRKVKTYCNVETGQKFSSKKEVMQYIERNASQSTPQPSSKQSKLGSKETTPIVEQSSENPEWLPPGWITEVKVKGGSGKPYKVYIDPESGSKYYSKPEVSRYLERLKSVSTSTSAQKKTGGSPVIKPDVDGFSGEKSSSKRDASQNRRSERSNNRVTKQEEITVSKPSTDDVSLVATDKGTPDELPTGWIKEIKTKKSASGMRKYPSYTDPVSGYMFSSKKDALRYVETGSFESCAVKPKKRETNDPKLTSGNAPQKSGQSGNVKPSSSKPDESANVKSTINKNGIDEQLNVALGEPSTNNVVTEQKSPDELPPGWIKEIKIKKSGNRAKKYVQYTDPLSGYIFNSKRDALRYLGTGDVGSCSTKPSKRDTDDPELINGKISAIIHSLSGLESFLEPDAPQNNGTTVKTDSVDKAVNELPPEWITEVKTKKSVSGTRKYQLYVEPSTGYEFKSKKDALRYLETSDINKCAVKPKKREIDDNNINAVVSTNEKKDEITITNSKIDEKIDEVTIMSPPTDEKKAEVPEWLPSGWTMEYKTKAGATPRKYKCYIDPSTGRKFYSKPDVFRYLKSEKNGPVAPEEDKEVEPVSKNNLTGGESSSVPDKYVDRKLIENKICTSEQKEVAVDKQSIDNVTVVRSSTDELPPGWIKEIRIKTGIYGTRKDPFYIDPLSGYEFRSLKDSLRYVATRDIRKCALRPRKRNTDEPNLTNSSVEAKASSQQRTTRSEISAGKESSVPEIHDNSLNDNLTKESLDSITVGSKRKVDTEKSAEETTIATPATTTKASKRKRGQKSSAKKRGKASKRKRDPEASSEEASSEEASSEDKPKKKRGTPFHTSIPTRTSKRLVGLEPNTPINLSIIGGAPVVHEGDSTQSINLGFSDGAPEGDRTQSINPDGTPNSATAVETEKEIVLNDSAEEMLSAELLNKIEKALQEHAAIVEKIEKPLEEEEQQQQQHETPAVTDDVIEKPFEHQAVIYELIEKPLENNQAVIKNDRIEKPLENNQEIIKNDPIEKPVEEEKTTFIDTKQNDEVAAAEPPPGMQNPQVFYPMMESWSDPCLEFAFKTLTGALPVQDNTGTDDYFQRQVAPHPTVNNEGLSSFQGLPNYFQNPFSLNLNEPQRPVPRPGPTQQFPVNPNYMPSTSNGGTQQNPTWKQV